MTAKILIRDKVTILACAIRSLARQAGYNPRELTKEQAVNFGEAQGWRGGTIAGVFYRSCTDKQWNKVLRELG